MTWKLMPYRFANHMELQLLDNGCTQSDHHLKVAKPIGITTIGINNPLTT
jgi:hypothetical protein